MRLTNIFNISGIAVAVNSRNVTFENNVSTVFEMSAIHELSHLQPSLELLVSTPSVYHHRVLFYAPTKVMLCGPRYAFAFLLIYHQ